MSNTPLANRANRYRMGRLLGAAALVLAAPSGWAVIADVDDYATDEDVALMVAAPGVLGNDNDEGNPPLTVIANTDPTNGSVTVDSDGGFTYTPDPEFFGVDSFQYTVQDGLLGVDTADVTITVDSVNDVPVVTGPVPDGTFTEDNPGSVDLSGVFSDVEDADLDYTIEGGTPAFVDTANMTGASLDLTFLQDQTGTGTITVRATDDDGAFEDAVVNIEVTEVNDPPVVSGVVPSGTFTEDTPGSVDMSGVFSDVEDADLDYTVEGAVPAFVDTATMTGDSLDLTFVLDQTGTGTITVRATDDDGAFEDAVVNIEVTEVNDPPVVSGVVPSGTFSEDTPGSVDLTGVFTDVEDADLDYTVEGAVPAFVDTATMIGTSLDLTFVLDQTGTGTITVRATDDDGAFVDAVVNIEVTDVNDPPVVSGVVPVGAFIEDTPGSVDLTGVFSDVEDADLDYTVEGTLPAFVNSATLTGASLDLTFVLNQHGTGSITVRATDDDGAFVDAVVNVDVAAVNDAPTVANPIANVSSPEDGPDIIVDLSTVFDDVDTATDGDVLTLVIAGNSNAAMFDVVEIVGTQLRLDLAFDQNGTATIQISATDTGPLTVIDTFDVVVGGVNDFPSPVQDSITIDEDSGPVLIDVLVNDYLAEQPTGIATAGVDGGSESTPIIVLDPNGDPIGGANGTVVIVGNQIEYTPKQDFFGVDFFHYTIVDSNGDTSCSPPDVPGPDCWARVTVTVNAVNDSPVDQAQEPYSMLENGILEVTSGEGLLFGAYDVEGARVDPLTGVPPGMNLSIVPLTFPPLATGILNVNSANGSFTFTPGNNVTGDVTFTYQISDGVALSAVYEGRISIYPAPPPPAPPPAGEVAVTFNLSNVPLEQSTSVAPNVIVMMDDSGSMDWNMSVRGADENGGFVIDNDVQATSSERSTSYYYLWNLNGNIFGTSDTNGRILPTQEGLQADTNTDNSQYGVWRARSHKHNRLYYNPGVRYTPWVGQDDLNIEYGDAVPTAIRLNPRVPGDVFNMMNTHSYHSDNIPRWQNSGGTEDQTHSVYIPHYYATTANPPLQWNDPFTRIQIINGAGPLAGGQFPGGPARDDCAVDDGDPLDCTYAQEIQNFANFFQYYRTREYAAKNGLGKVISQVQDIRVGYETINDNRSEPVRDMNDLHTEGNKKLLMDDIYRTNSSGSTPLRRALDRAGDIFSGTHGDDPLLPAPEGFCQQNFTLLFSDGYWNGGDPAQQNEDSNGPGPYDGGMYADTVSETLADVAMYFYERDLRLTMENLVPVSQRDRLGAPAGTFDDGGSARMHQHMKTYTVAFGVVGDVDPASLPVDPTVAFAWPNPESSPQGKIDDMLHAAVNGRGQFLSAVDPQELQTALEAAFLEFTQAASSTSAAAFNSTSVQEGTLLYRGFYDLRDFTGELSATLVNPDGTINPVPVWRASEQLNPAYKQPNNRVLVTFDPAAREGIPFRHADLTADQQSLLSEDVVNYLRGQRGDEQPTGSLRRRPTVNGLLGDIVNSSPVFVGSPRGLNRDQAPYPEADGSLYSEFVESEMGRHQVVYVGANDGMLHGFDASTGEEMFGFVPNKLIDASQNYHNELDEFASPFYQHKYYVDQSPRVTDAYVRGSTSSSARDWNTLLIGGLGVGGKGFYALNVSDPATYASENSARNAVLWEFTDADDTSPNGALDPFGAPVKDLGYSLSLPSLAMSNVPDGDGNSWVAIFGNGPNSTAGIAKLFVLFMDEGLDGWSPGDFVKLDTGRGVPIAPEQLAGFPNGLGTPALVDTDLNGTVDWVYAGDRLGNLYRFDLCDRDPVTEECSTNPADWTVTRLFTASYNEGGVERLQPILTEPLVIKHPHEDGFVVIFGTGSYMTREDADSEEIQSIYAIWDRGEASPAMAQNGSKYSRLVEQTLSNVVDDSTDPAMTRRALTHNVVEYEPDGPSTTGTYGWYIDLDMPRATTTLSGAANPDVSGRTPPQAQFPGEKAIRRLVFRNGAIVTTTVLPSLDEFSCYGTRPGAILLLDALTGGDVGRPVVDFNNDGVIDDGDLVNVGGDQVAAGLLFNQSDLDGALVDLSTLGGEGNYDWLFACGGTDCLPMALEQVAEGRTGRLSWRELDESN